MNTSMDSLSIEISSVAKDSSAAVNQLIAKLDALRTSLQNVIKESNNFTKLKSNIETVGKAATSKASTNASTTSGSDYGTYHEQLYKLGVGDLGDSSYAKLKSTVATTNSEIKKFVTTNNEVVTVSKSTKNGLENVRVSVKTLGDESKKTASSWGDLAKGFAAGIAKITATYAILSRLASKLGGFVKEAAAYEESMNLFMVTLGDKAKEANEWVEKFSNALYLDSTGVRQYMGSFNSLTKGLGVGADKAYIMSKNLTQLTYDLASFKNLSFDTAFRKLQSAMSGEIEPLRNVGPSLSQATLQELAYSMGIEKRVANMNEAEKAQLRYIQILKSTSEWQTDMGATLVTPANALRILQQQFTLLARAIGQIFIPILMNVIPYVMVLTQALTKLAQRLASLLGYKIQDVNYDRISGGLGGISDGIEDIGDNAGKTAKKLNTMLAPFDELNVVQNQLDKSGKGSGNDLGGGGLDLPLPEYDALANLNDQLTKKMDEAKQKLKDFLPILATIGGAFAAWKIGKKVADFMTWWDKLSGGGKTAARIGLSVSLIVLGLGLTFDGNKNVVNKETLLKGIAEQIGGATLVGAGAGLLTKSVPVGIFVGLALLGFSGSKTASHGDWENGVAGFLEQGFAVAGITGLAFKLSGGNPVVTLAVAATVTWANVFFDLAELAEMKPTSDELYDAIFVELNPFYDLGTSIGDAIYDGITKMPEKVSKVAESIGGVLGDKWDNIKKDTKDKWKNIKKTIGDSLEDAKKNGKTKLENFKADVSKKWEDIKSNTSTKWEDTKKTVEGKIENLKNNGKTKIEDLKNSISQKWENIKSNTSTIWENIKSTVSTKVEDLKKNGSTKIEDLKKGISDKWSSIKSNTSSIWDGIKTTVGNKFTDIKNSARDKFQGVKDQITSKWSSAKSWLSSNIGDKNTWSSKFGGILDGASSVLGKLKDKFTNWKGSLKMPHIKWVADGFKTSGSVKKALKFLNLPTTLPTIKVSWYAQGGFPKDGEFFVANENGPEMIGRIGNRSAVANNDQIETSLTNALLTALNSYDFGGKGGPTTIYIGNKKVYEGYGDYVNSENDRYGTSTIRV